MAANKILKVSTHAAKIILENGGETYRVEDTVCRICKVYGYSAECFAILTGIMASLEDHNGNVISIVVRISKRGTNLDKIHKVSNLSRKASEYTPEKLMELLNEIEDENKYSIFKNFLAYAFSAASFAVIFGGTYKDFSGALFTGAALNIFACSSKRIEINKFIINSIGGAICAIIGVLFLRIGLIDNLDKVIIGSLMLLVPGMAITNAVRDIIEGDFVAGITRGAEAFLIATSLAVGTGAALSLLL